MSPFNIINGTIVPAHFPKSFTPEELHKLGFNAAITLSWFTIIGIFALILRTRDWRKFSFTSLSIAWFTTVAVVAFGIFSRFGHVDNLLAFLAIGHIQVESLIITYLLGYSFNTGFTCSFVVGTILCFVELAAKNVSPGFTGVTIIGGWGDIFMPLVLWSGGRRLLALGALGHFLNAFVTFFAFVYYIPLDLYFGLQIVTGNLWVYGIVAGIVRLQTQQALALGGSDSEAAAGLVDPTFDADKDEGHIMPPPTHKQAVKLAILALVLALLASLPIVLIQRGAK